ncbi:hypothetical protein [Lentibacillus sediminis]|uniref:hypothetical protein n=1 Tax=Lentibacillus sediminis TaxID=1940529 RepID=UPI000C1C648C|nr:hypothetical protein [Lentibacillus sediminis]
MPYFGSAIEKIGNPDIYKEYGISNIFAYSFVHKGYFKMYSYSEEKFSKGKKQPDQSSLEKDEDSKIVLKGRTNNVKSKISSIDAINMDKSTVIDPFGREG